MRSLHLVDPELLPVLEAMPALTITHATLPQARKRPLPTLCASDVGVALERVAAPGPPGAPGVALDIYRPRASTGVLPCIYHMHGGGYVARSARDMEFMLAPLVAELGCAVVTVDYRLAPETPFPGAVEDCYAGLRWTVEHARAVGLDASRLGVMGESAGGGLAAGLALLARDRGEYALAFQHLAYPMLDDRTCRSEPHPFAGEFLWTRENNHFGWTALLGEKAGADGISAYAAPARADDLSRLPPAYISTGALDLFAEEDIEYARRLMRAGVSTELHVYPGAFHAFDVVAGTRVADAARRDSRAALRRFLWG